MALVEIYYRGAADRPLVTIQQAGRKGSRAAVRRLSCPLRLLRKFCVSEFRQNQGFHIINVHNDGLFPLATTLPIERDGMRAARGVNAVALYRES